MSLKTVTTARGNIAVQYKCHNYRKDRTLVTGDVSWRCVSRSCSATLKTSSDLKKLRSKSGVHNHPTSTNTSPAPSPPVTPSELASPQDSDTLHDDPSTPSPTPSLTELLSPYTTITPVPPKYNSLDKENSYLRQRVAELEYMTDALTNKAIDLETQLINIKNSEQISSDTLHSPLSATPHPPSPPEKKHLAQLQTLMTEIEILKQPCEKCKIFDEEIKNMLQAIRSLEEEIKTLKIHPSTAVNASSSFPTVMPGRSDLQLKNSFGILTAIEDPGNDDHTFTIVKHKHVKRNKSEKPKKTHKKQNKWIPPDNIKKNIEIPFRHVTVVGDSHSRGLAALMSPKTTRRTRVTGVCKPGAGLLDIAPTSTPPLDHAYVLIAGTNDVAAGREDVIFKHMEHVIHQCKKSSRVLVAPLLPRHDLPPGSPIHESVALVNNFISELCHRHEGVEVLDISSLDRQHHTRHGLHLNAAGKTLIASLIIEQLAQTSWSCHRRRPAKRLVPTPQSSPTPHPFIMDHESYADAVKTTLQSSPIRQTDSRKTEQSLFLGNPSLAAQN